MLSCTIVNTISTLIIKMMARLLFALAIKGNMNPLVFFHPSSNTSQSHHANPSRVNKLKQLTFKQNQKKSCLPSHHPPHQALMDNHYQTCHYCPSFECIYHEHHINCTKIPLSSSQHFLLECIHQSCDMENKIMPDEDIIFSKH